MGRLTNPQNPTLPLATKVPLVAVKTTGGRLGAPVVAANIPIATEKPTGFWKGLAQGIAKPALRFGQNTAGVLEIGSGLASAGVKAITGDKEGAKKRIVQMNDVLNVLGDEGTDFGYLGNAKTYDTRNVKTPSDVITKGLPTILGAGGEVGSYALGGGGALGVKQIIKTGFEQGVKQAAKVGGRLLAKNAIVDFLAGSIAGGATASLEKDATPGSITKGALASGAISAVATPVLGAVARGGITSIRGLLKAGGKLLDTTAGALERKAGTVDAPVFQKPVFHGTKAPISDINQSDVWQYGDEGALFGQGTYLTDSKDIAQGYARGKGKGPEGKILEGYLNPNTKLLDLEKSLASDEAVVFNSEINAVLKNYGLEGSEDVTGMTGKEAFKKFKEVLSDAEIPKYEAGDYIDAVQRGLKEKGYHGFSHIGGVLGGTKSNISIIFPDETGIFPKGRISNTASIIPKTPVTDRIFANVDKPKPSITEKVAGATASTIRTVQKIPTVINKHIINRYSPIGKFRDTAKEAGIDTPDLEDMAQATKYKATGQAQNRLDDYVGLIKNYGPEWQYVKESSRYLDALDRLSTGQSIEGGHTIADVQSSLAALGRNLTPEQRLKVTQGTKDLQVFLNKELEDAVESGRISKEQYDIIRQAHPNYVPHDVLDFLDVEIPSAGQGLGKTLQLTKSGIDKAKGSTRAIDDIDNAVVRRMFKSQLLNEKNKTMKAIVETGTKMGDESGFVPLRTEANVQARRDLWTGIKKNRETLNNLVAEFRASNSVSKETIKELKKLDDLLSTQEGKFRADLASYQGMDGELERLHESLIRQSESQTNERSAIDDFFSGQPEVKLGYEEFSKLAHRRPWMLDTAIDRGSLESRLSKNEVRTIFEGTAGTKIDDNDLLEEFKSLYLRERTLRRTEPIARQIQKLNASEKQTRRTMGNVEKTQGEINATTEFQNDLTAQLRSLEGSIDAQKNLNQTAFDDLRTVRDIEMKKVDIPKDKEKVSYFKNGIREDYLVPKELGLAIKNLGGDDANIVMNWLNNSMFGKAITAPGTLLRAVATSKNPIFTAFSNPARDVQTAQFTAQALPQDFSFGLLKSINANLRGKTDDEFYRLAREAGALQGTLLHETSQNPEKLLAKKLSRGNVVSRTLSKNWNPLQLVENVGSTMEEMTRLAVFKRSLASGATPQAAAKMARDATVDFGKSGHTIQILNRVIPFLNARIQGFTNLGKAIVNNPEKAVRIGMMTAAYPAAVLSANNMKYESYENVPDNEKRKYWIIMVGESEGVDVKGEPVKIPHYVKIPKGEAQQAISNVVERTLTLSQEQYPETTSEFIVKLVGDISPVTESSVLPAGLQQAIETRTNYSLYRQAPIEGKYTKIGDKWFETSKIPAKYRTTSSTSEVAKYLGSVLNWSPVKIDYVIKTGVLNDLIRGTDLIKKGPIRPEGTRFERAAEWPGAKTLLGTSSYGKYLDDKKATEKQEQSETNEKIQGILNPTNVPMVPVSGGRLKK